MAYGVCVRVWYYKWLDQCKGGTMGETCTRFSEWKVKPKLEHSSVSITAYGSPLSSFDFMIWLSSGIQSGVQSI